MRAGPKSTSFPESDSNFRGNNILASWDLGQRMKRQWQSQSQRSKWSLMHSGLLRSKKRQQDPSLDSVALSKRLCVLYQGEQTHTSVPPVSLADLLLHWPEILHTHLCRTGMRSSPVKCLQTLAAPPPHSHTHHTNGNASDKLSPNAFRLQSH